MQTIMTRTHHPPTPLLTMGPQGCFVHCWNGPGCTPSPLEWAPDPYCMHLYLPQCQVMKSQPMHTLAPVASLLLVGAPPGCLPHISSSTLSQFFMVSPVKTGTSFENFQFFMWAHTHTTHPLCCHLELPPAHLCVPLQTFSAPLVHLWYTPAH